MRLEEFGFLADENVEMAVVHHLLGRGCDVVRAQDAGLAGLDDRALLDAARGGRRVILTHDNDFGRLAVFEGSPLFGIVHIRPGATSPSLAAAAIETILSHVTDIEPPFIVVATLSGARVSIRVRNPV